MNKYTWLAGALLLATTALGEGKPPEFWCRAEPIVLNGDDYLRYGLTQEEACGKALRECDEHYRYCEVTGCGEWFDGKTEFKGYCELMVKQTVTRL